MQAEIQVDSYADAADKEVDRSCPAPATAECIARIVEASHEHQRAEYDLNAQRDMAKWALAMVLVSAAGTGVGLLGLLFIADTLRATRKGNKINRRIGEAQVRAYLSATRGSYECVEGYCTANLIIDNEGHSPASKVEVHWLLTAKLPKPGEGSLSAVLDPDRIEIDIGKSFVARIPTSAPVTASVNFSNETLYHARSDEVISGIGSGDRVEFACTVKWLDVFDREQVEKFYLVNGKGAERYEDVGDDEFPQSIYIYEGSLRAKGSPQDEPKSQ